MPSIIVSLTISAEEYQKLYAGVANNVSCLASDGRRVQFPARILQRYVTRAGVSGQFRIEFDDQGKFQDIHSLS